MRQPRVDSRQKDIYKTVIATNSYGCADTATVVILVPPADDYTVTVDSIYCSANDSLYTGFTICNHFKRGIVAQRLSLSFL